MKNIPELRNWPEHLWFLDSDLTNNEIYVQFHTLESVRLYQEIQCEITNPPLPFFGSDYSSTFHVDEKNDFDHCLVVCMEH